MQAIEQTGKLATLAIIGMQHYARLVRLQGFSWRSHIRRQVRVTILGRQEGVLQRQFHLVGQAIPAMEWEDRYKHLGVLLGPNPDSCLDELVADFR